MHVSKKGVSRMYNQLLKSIITEIKNQMKRRIKKCAQLIHNTITKYEHVKGTAVKLNTQCFFIPFRLSKNLTV
jgi:hypothetical protein